MTAIVVPVLILVLGLAFIKFFSKKKGKAPVVDLDEWEMQSFHDTKYKQ